MIGSAGVVWNDTGLHYGEAGGNNVQCPNVADDIRDRVGIGRSRSPRFGWKREGQMSVHSIADGYAKVGEGGLTTQLIP